jgi:hypothetical protein
VSAQEDLLSLLGEEDTKDHFVTATFKTTRITNGHSIENTHSGVLDFRINHRFGFISSGIHDLFGLDNSSVRLGLDFGLSERWMIGLGRSSYQKNFDFFTKYKLIRQSTKLRKSPLSMSLMLASAITAQKFDDPDRNDDFSSRVHYTAQLLIARKFSNNLSLQIMPTIIHRNLVETAMEKNDIFSLGLGGRYKLSNRIALTAEYYYVPKGDLPDQYKNSFGLGFDIETGGHVFQLHFTNSTSMVHNGYIAETEGDFFDGDIHFGFNISRVFTIVKPEAFR